MINKDDLFRAKIVLKGQRYPQGKVENGGYAILSAEVIEVTEGNTDGIDDWNKQIILKGTVPVLDFKASYNFTGEYIEDAQWGKQYNIIALNEQFDIETDEDKRAFLSLVLTESQLNNLYNMYDNPFDLIANENVPELIKVKGIGVATSEKLIDRFKANIDNSKAYLGLMEYGLTKNMIDKLVESYESIDILIGKIKENPYVIAGEVDGIGWKKADSIALGTGIDRLSHYRLSAFITYYLEQRANRGDSWVTPVDVMEALWGEIDEDLNREHTKPVFDKLYEDEIVIWDEERTFIALSKYYHLERSIAENLIRINNSTNTFEYEGWEKITKEIEREQGWEYTDEQLKGIETVLKNQVVVITGFPGTGKTSIANAMMKVLEQYSKGLCALAGRASARVSETTGLEGYTIHRLLGYNPTEGYIYNRNRKLPIDIILLDETSMVGGKLYYRLVQAIENGSKFIMLGDDGQLESIGTLNIFKDLLDSGIIPSVKLTKIHRQAKKSAIITESAKLREGQQLFKSNWTGIETRGELQDLKLEIYDEKEMTFFAVMDNFKEQLKKYKNINDVQVIVPVKYRGDASLYALNNEIQDYYNPQKGNWSKEMSVKRFVKKQDFSYVLKEGDKVINRKNNRKATHVNTGKEIPIWNGDIGIVKEINGNSGLIITFQTQGDVYVRKNKNFAIELGYAITVHSSQGSEYKSVIVGIDYSSYSLLTRELINTAITRAQKHCVLCAENTALEYAINTSRVPHKQTFLHKFLHDMQEEYLGGEVE